MRACHDRRADLSKRSGHRQHNLGRPGWLAGRRRGIEQSDGNGVTPALPPRPVHCQSLCPCSCPCVGHPTSVGCLSAVLECMHDSRQSGARVWQRMWRARVRVLVYCQPPVCAPNTMHAYEACLHKQVVSKARTEVFVSVWLDLAPGAPSWQTLPFHLWLYCGMPVSPLTPR